jgi:hypothetical protein
MPLTDDDLASATAQDSMRVALLVLANAALDTIAHIRSHDGPPCVIGDLEMMAKMATAAAEGRLAAEHIERFRTFLEFRAMGESQGRG